MTESGSIITGIRFDSDSSALAPEQVRGFFVGWPNPPDEPALLRILNGSVLVELALDEANGNLVGFATAISDGVLAAYIPLLEVLPTYQHRGIGTRIIRRLFGRLERLYMVDLLCDAEMLPFYERLGMQRTTSAFMRNYGMQRGIQD